LLRRVGALVEAPSLYPNLTGRENLQVTATLTAAGKERIERVLRIVRLQAAADRLVGGYSSGMRQRLGLALALLNDPQLLILDEPTSGLDPSGMIEMRELLCRLPAEHGVTVFLSSHLLAEVEQVATHIGIIDRGQLRFQGTLNGLHAQMEEQVTLGVEQPAAAAEVLQQAGWAVRSNGGNRITVAANGRSDAVMINHQLVNAGVKVFHLSVEQPSLEDIFLTLTEKAEGGK
jgi:ABC-2 type transport system ATP-binding protein